MERQYKLIVHVPPSHADAVRDAIGGAGGGQVENYTHCSFSIRGTGRFIPNENSAAYIGQAGQYEQVEEESIEVSPISEDVIKDVVAAMIEAHPYEETGYEVFELVNVDALRPRDSGGPTQKNSLQYSGKSV